MDQSRQRLTRAPHRSVLDANSPSFPCSKYHYAGDVVELPKAGFEKKINVMLIVMCVEAKLFSFQGNAKNSRPLVSLGYRSDGPKANCFGGYRVRCTAIGYSYRHLLYTNLLCRRGAIWHAVRWDALYLTCIAILPAHESRVPSQADYE